MLVPAAIEAVSQWRYRPYILNSEPIEVETQITVNFVLIGKPVSRVSRFSRLLRDSVGAFRE